MIFQKSNKLFFFFSSYYHYVDLQRLCEINKISSNNQSNKVLSQEVDIKSDYNLFL